MTRTDLIHIAADTDAINAIAHAAVVALRNGEITGREMVAVRRAARTEISARAAATFRPDETL